MKINEIKRKYKTLARLQDIPIPSEIRRLYQSIVEYNKNKSIPGTQLFPAPNLMPVLVKGFNEVTDQFINWLPDDPSLTTDKAMIRKLKYKLSQLK